jgi:hypothetical protein
MASSIDMTAPNRATALITGARFYRALRPCVNGHEPVRYTAGCGCVGCHKARARGLLQSTPRGERYNGVELQTNNYRGRGPFTFEATLAAGPKMNLPCMELLWPGVEQKNV